VTELEEQLRSLRTPTRPLPAVMPAPMPSLHDARDRRRTAWLVAASLVALVAVAAGVVAWANGTRPQPVATTPGPSGTTSGASFVLEPTIAVTADQLDADVPVLQARLDALGIHGATVVRRDLTIEVSAPDDRGIGDVSRLLVAGELELRPVLRAESTHPSPGTALMPLIPGSVVSNDLVFDDGTQLLTTGEPVMVGGVERAEAAISAQSGRWTIRFVFFDGPTGIDAFNAIAARCYVKDATCPTGQLALVVQGELLSAPTINASRFERDQIEISGNFSEESAKAVATEVGQGHLPVALRVR
jgi:preprotein translocase subunit SecD